MQASMQCGSRARCGVARTKLCTLTWLGCSHPTQRNCVDLYGSHCMLFFVFFFFIFSPPMFLTTFLLQVLFQRYHWCHPVDEAHLPCLGRHARAQRAVSRGCCDKGCAAAVLRRGLTRLARPWGIMWMCMDMFSQGSALLVF